MSNSIQYRPEVDGLGALAVMPVVLYHAGLNVFSGGFIGVDIFFVISGYLITSIIYRELQQEKFSLIRFYERRARRILPAITFVMVCCIPVALLILDPLQLESFCESVVAVIFYISNVYFWWTRDYFSEAADFIPLLHTWSLGVEEQFYFLFPLLMISLGVFKTTRLIMVFVLIGFLSIVLSQYSSGRYDSFNFYLLPTRAWELLTGSFLAVLLSRQEFFGRKIPYIAKQIMPVIGISLIIYSVLFFDNSTPFPGIYALAPVFGAALVIFFAEQSTLIGRLLASVLFVKIGILSYSIYLWHQPLFAFYRVYFDADPEGMSIGLLLVATGILSYLTWRLIETPFRNRERISVSKLVGPLALVTAGLVGFGVVGHLNKGFSGRFEESILSLASTAKSSPMRDRCHTSGVDFLHPRDACVYGNGELEWAVLGDSHAVELAFALSEELIESKKSLKHFTFSSCSPEINYKTNLPGCATWLEAVLAELEQNSSVQNVVISYYHLAHENSERPIDGNPSVDERKTLYYSSIERISSRLVEAGKHVTIVLPFPRLESSIFNDVYPQHIFKRNSPEHENQILGADIAKYYNESAFARSALQDIANRVPVSFIDPAEALCRSRCLSYEDGKLLYFDDHHISVHGAKLIAELFSSKTSRQ